MVVIKNSKKVVSKTSNFTGLWGLSSRGIAWSTSKRSHKFAIDFCNVHGNRALILLCVKPQQFGFPPPGLRAELVP